MTPKPVAIALTICDLVIVDERTKNISTINQFSRLKITSTPSPPRAFAVFALLKDGLGNGTIEIAVTRQETDSMVYDLRRPIHFPDRLKEVRSLFRLHDCSFPAPGKYIFTLLVDGEWIAHQELEVVLVRSLQ